MRAAFKTAEEILKEDLRKLLLDDMDQFQLLDRALRLSVNLNQEEIFSKQKYCVQKVVLEQLLKSEDSDNYKQLLEETNKTLQFKKTSKYLCSLVGCLFQAEKHRSYLQHLRRVHSTHNEFVCQFAHQCKRQFSTLNLLIDHVKTCHSAKSCIPQPAAAVPFYEELACKCNLLSCRGLELPSVAKLMSHITNFHSQEERQCIFVGCSTRFSSGVISTVRNHFNEKHKKTKQLELKLQFRVNPN